MKGLFILLFLLLIQLAFSQKQSLNFSNIDRKVLSIEAYTPDSLSRKLTSSYVTDLEKLRSIFRWVTENIAYRTINNRNYFRKNHAYVYEDTEDTTAEYGSLNERIALQVLKQKEAVCDGYARLLKVLCDHAGLRCEIITGYARADINRMGAQFKSNHRWNAVLLDSSWYLLDATWASGFIGYNSNEFIKAYDDHYFLTPPEQFIGDHYPEDARWTLLENPPTLKEFYHTPFKHSAFNKYSIQSFAPVKGVIEAAVGDTVLVQLSMADIGNNVIASDTLKEEIAWLPPTKTLEPLQPVKMNNKSISYQYAITSSQVEWLNVVFNDDVIMRYKLNVRRNKEE